MTRPGDVRPTLPRPPGDRYASRPRAPVLERPRVGRALGYGLVAVVAVALVYALLRSVLDLTSGLIAVAAGGGWVIGAGVRAGAWGGMAHRASGVPVALAMVLGSVAWVASLLGAWLMAMAILPGSSRSFPERLSATPFLDWLSPQLDVLDLLDLGLLVLLAWVGSRSDTTDPDDGLADAA